MENIEFEGMPFKALLLVVVLNVLVYFVLQILRKYLFVFIKSDKWQAWLKKAWTRITLIIWLVIWLLTLIYLLNESFFVTVVLLALVLVIGGKYWKDLISGLTIKFEDRISKGDYLTKENYDGVVQQLGLRGVFLRMKNGENAFIPYRDLTAFSVRKLDRGVKSELQTVEVKFIPTVAMDTAMDKLRIEVLLIPYTLLTHSVQVEVVEVDESGTTLRAVLHTKSQDTGKLAKKALLISLVNQDLIIQK